MKKGMDSKAVIDKMLEDTSKTIESIKNDIEKTIVDYTFVPGKDIIETDDSIIVRVDLAGIKKENIELNLTETNLKVKADFEDELVGEVRGNNRRPTLIRRTVRFPRKVCPDEAEAKFENGLLTVEVPKLEKKQSFTIDIK
ncbi:heat shock protein Hsp20 [Methanobacterium lacus]|uniref:Heat shock protein Hsp20 n=1 Tax=Methanobacterium lacus (strain AL-21) TaxID=877455 RepID=F0TCJ7_METLA|nr:Hsp20/alpha crystallin family protein [Methanobacterium lacus]ADZ09274.1 heat shock protein Hsp20 [Methanobacterium lacus]